MERLLLFDIDGTLLRTKGAGRVSTKAAMLEVFGTASTIDTHHFGGKTDWFTLSQLLQTHGHTPESIGERLKLFEESIGRHITANIAMHPAKSLPGAMEAVLALRQRADVLLGIVTGNAPTSAAVKLRSAGYDPAWFLVGAYGTESMDRNDLPRFAMERARALPDAKFRPETTVIIGDTVMDVLAARANDMRVIAVKTGFEDPAALEAAEPDILLDDLTTLLDVL